MDAEKSNPGNILMNIPKPNVGMLPTDRLDYSPITDRKPLKLAEDESSLQCTSCGRIYPVRDGIPILLIESM